MHMSSDNLLLADQSGYHMAFVDNALNVNCTNAKGGCQPLIHDTLFEGKPIAMTKLARN